MAGHASHTSDVAPEMVEYLPLRQRAQDAEPEELLYLPTVQLVHGPPSGPLEPALHVHALLLVLPEGEVERDGQLDTRRVVE